MTTTDAREQSDFTAADPNAELEIDHTALDQPRSKWQAAEEAAAHAQATAAALTARNAVG